MIDGKGRGCIDGVVVALGGAGTIGLMAGVAVGAAAETGDKVALGVWPGDWRTLGVGEADKATVALGRAVGAIVATGAGVIGAATAGVATGGAVAATVGLAGETPAASDGFRNFLGGAFGGGVASVLILVRARSAAD